MDENPEKKKKTFLIVGAIAILIFIIVVFFVGVQGIFDFLGWILFFGLLSLLLFLIFYAVYHLFIKPHKIDITYMNKQKLISSARISRPPMVNDLYVSGDKDHQSFRLGKIVGWTRVEIFKPKSLMQNKKSKGKKPEKEVEKDVEDVFVIESKGAPFKWFGDPAVIRVSPDDHTELLGDVYIKGFSLIKLSEYYYLNKDMLDIGKVDFNILQEAKRGVMFLMLADLKQITDEAIGVNPQHNLNLQQTKMFPKQIPPPPTSPPAT